MAPPRTGKDLEVLRYIKSYIEIHHRAPTVREIAEGVGLNSPASIHRYLRRLKDEGRIEWDRYGTRGIRILS